MPNRSPDAARPTLIRPRSAAGRPVRGRSTARRPTFASVLAMVAVVAAGCRAGGGADVPREPRAGSVAEATAVPARGDVRAVVISDLNSAYGSTDYEPAVHRGVALIRDVWRPDLVLAAGDLIAGQRPLLGDDEVRAMWAAFDAVVGRPLREASIPFGFTLGNHDGSAYPAHRRDRALALRHWRDPTHDPGLRFVDRAGFPVHYSFEQRGVFVLVWDASNDETLSNHEMMDWAVRQLRSPAARAASHRLVLGHLPLHAVAEGRNRPGEVLAHADSLRALLERNGVDIYVSGHHHAYYPGCRGGLQMLHAGALGQGARRLLGSGHPAAQTITILDFHLAADSVAYTTYAFDPEPGPDGTQRKRLVPASELPPRLTGFNGWVARRDLCGH